MAEQEEKDLQDLCLETHKTVEQIVQKITNENGICITLAQTNISVD